MSQNRERGHDTEELIRTALEDFQSRLWTSAPGIVKGYDPQKQTVKVQLSIKAVQRMPDGSTKHVSLPVLQDVPVQFPGAGGHMITFPVKEGDECLVTFSARSPDAWQQNGGEQPPVDAGMHSLSNGFAMLGFRSNPEAKKIAGGADPDAITIRHNDGQTMLSIKSGEIIQKTGATEMKQTSDGWDFTGGHIKHNGKRIDDQHKHDGIVVGGDLTGFPQA